MNKPLFSAIFSISSTVLMGILMIIAFVTRNDTMPFIVGAIVIGFLVSIPIAWVITKKISQLGSN